MDKLFDEIYGIHKNIEKQTAHRIKENRRLIREIFDYDICNAIQEQYPSINEEQRKIILEKAMNESLYCEHDDVKRIALDYSDFYMQMIDKVDKVNYFLGIRR